jgi:hypothetical protein
MGLGAHGTERQTGYNTAAKVRAIEEGRGVSVSKNVEVCTDGASNMSSDEVGAAQFLVDWSDRAVKGVVVDCFYVSVVY